MSLTSPEPGSASRQWRPIAVIFGAVVAILVVAYVWFLQDSYAVLVQDARPEEAAAIVEELKKEDVAFQLRDGGATILVPESKLNAARLDVSSKELPLKGTVGFELFNESDMGQTDFAQKVNYQRALQGEITRTLMAMEGIASARVHIALPERSLFRAARSEPRAAVTVTPATGIAIDADRVAGIQRLVAATVPDLAVERVAVLNERGRLLTTAYVDISTPTGTDLERNYVERARRAIGAALPQLQFDLKIATVARTNVPVATGSNAAQSNVPARDHSIRLILFTRSPLQPADELAIRSAIDTELTLSPAYGDSLEFSRTPEIAAPFAQQVPYASHTAGPASPTAVADKIVQNWLIAMGILAILLSGAWSLRQRSIRVTQRDRLVGRIREQLRLEQGARG